MLHYASSTGLLHATYSDCQCEGHVETYDGGDIWSCRLRGAIRYSRRGNTKICPCFISHCLAPKLWNKNT